MKVKTAEATLLQLDWLVAKCEGVDILVCLPNGYPHILRRKSNIGINFNPSTDWSLGGPIIEREVICILPHASGGWLAKVHGVATRHEEGQTPLIAAMRCYVASKLGDEVEIPGELLN